MDRTRGGFIKANFDNVYVNGTLYDNFDGGNQMDSNKWKELEIVRTIESGKFVSKLRRVGTSASNSLTFVNPKMINSFQADVTLQEYSSKIPFHVQG